MEIAEYVGGEFFGNALFGRAVGCEDMVAFGLGEGLVELDDVVKGLGHVYVTALGPGKDGLLQVGLRMRAIGLRPDLGIHEGIGVDFHVVLRSFGVAHDAFGRRGCEIVFLVKQRGAEGTVEDA